MQLTEVCLEFAFENQTLPHSRLLFCSFMDHHSTQESSEIQKKKSQDDHDFHGHPGSFPRQFSQRLAVGKAAMWKICNFKYLRLTAWYAWKKTMFAALIITNS